jgi:hypothetical protein
MGWFKRSKKVTAEDVYEAGTPFDERHDRSERSEVVLEALDPQPTKPVDEEYSGD